MFVRTERLFLRPAWPEDAPELARAAGHEAAALLCAEPAPQSALREMPKFLVTVPGEGGRIVGGIAARRAHGAQGASLRLRCWIEPAARTRGYATEALAAAANVVRSLGGRVEPPQGPGDAPGDGPLAGVPELMRAA